jgi:hypothetical protein
MIACATIVAKGYLSFARVLARSFREHHAGVPFLVLLADEVDGHFDSTREAFELIRLRDLGIARIERFQFQYAQQPLSYAATPYLLAHLLARGFSKVVFVKQEGLVLGSFSSLFQRLETASIVMTPHLVTPLASEDGIARELNILQSGSFNVGILGVSAGAETDRFLKWWMDRVSTHCRHAVTEGMHYEQRWLDLAPALFAGVHILRDPSYNVGHWSLPERTIVVRGDMVLVDDEPCRLFRFSGYDPLEPQWITRHSRRLTADTVGAASLVFDRFRSALYGEGFRDTSTWPYAYGAFDNGVPVPDVARDIYLTIGDRERFGDPFRTDVPGSYVRWLNENVDGPVPRPETLSRLWHAVYESRSDLQRAFPDVLCSDRQAFLNWTVQSGAQEHRVSHDFVPHLAV